MVTGVKGLFIYALWALAQAPDGDEPLNVVKRAIKAHGGEDRIAKSLTGRLTANATFAISLESAGKSQEFMGTIAWEESFELPRRYKRVIKGKIQDQPFSMEYAITKDTGWIRKGNGPIENYRGRPIKVNRHWNAMLAMLPPLLGKDAKLSPAGIEKIGEETAVGIKALFPEEGEATLYFSRKTGLLLKSKRLISHPLIKKEIAGTVLYGNYKCISGIQYPHRVTSYSKQKKLMELQITKIEFLKTLDDRLFDRP